MDIKARIEEVINQKGLTKKEVAERMGKFNQAFNSLLTNPKWETVERVADAIGISTCEMLYGIRPEAVLSTDPANSTEQPATQPEEPADLPFGPADAPQPATDAVPAQMVGLVRCPKCGHAIRLMSVDN